MKKRLLRLCVITLASIVVSVLSTAILMHFMFGNIPRAGLIIAALVPILAGLPITFFIDSQRRKLNMALADLKEAHGQLETLNGELEKQARFDFMTGFLNRRYFVQAVNEQCERTDKGAILCIDVDNFKVINDSFGHLVGDEALKMIAETISSATPHDALLARMGGEEFSVFLQPTDLKTARTVAERIRTAVEAMTFEPREGVTHDLSVSIGLAFTCSAHDFQALFGQADLHMYAAKQQGKNRVILPDNDDLEQVA
ncbi:GGDEF domain-containing protein [uncultured Cohaesibacter sp.]|uniref:GGDEF domain-containing protein n=1 Tax=uncultured Cohaesibacter sp. TaxID=1002546 RepID=UPI002AAB673D|nr:GGDEF domain-containing protein [uncultured Cohaesibacter sp.]